MAEGIIGNRAAGLVILRMVALGWAFILTFSGRAWEIPLFSLVWFRAFIFMACVHVPYKLFFLLSLFRPFSVSLERNTLCIACSDQTHFSGYYSIQSHVPIRLYVSARSESTEPVQHMNMYVPYVD